MPRIDGNHGYARSGRWRWRMGRGSQSRIVEAVGGTNALGQCSVHRGLVADAGSQCILTPVERLRPNPHPAVVQNPKISYIPALAESYHQRCAATPGRPEFNLT
ncbi:hypothetical protein IAQ61_010534 [Plenodomus lingam]|uniref:uncharacterized protein n=1 Tax=Leptosphaeria maculans TaxID=5022 RepID=UPI00331A6291|nr:hypothetical protein IAQ61_010534 [Plenodomus lingam]